MRPFPFRAILCASLLLQPFAAAQTPQYHQKLLITDLPGSPAAYSRVKRYVDLLGQELGAEHVRAITVEVEGRSQPADYRVYCALVDTTLECRLRQAVGYIPEHQQDSILAHFGQSVRRIDSLFPREYGQWLVINRYEVGGQVAVTAQPVAAAVQNRGSSALFAEEARSIDRFLEEPLIEVDTTAPAHSNHFGPSAYTAVFHAFQQAVGGAKISIFAPYRADFELQQGVRSLAELLEQLSRSPKQLVTVRLTGRQLKEYLEYNAAVRFFTLRGPDSDLLRPLRYPPADLSGLRYRIDLTKKSGNRVTIYQLQDGTPFSPEKVYTVVLDSFLARRFQRQGISPTVVHADYHVAWAAWLLANRTLRPRAADNWSAAPERWVQVIAERESKHLFGR